MNRRSVPLVASDDAPLNLDVLLAEDNPINQEVAISMLDLLGCQCTAVDNGRLAVEAIQRKTSY